ncbi:hypothetical protein FUA23_14455 [Neolewinella aurantiaca]|uniref:Uncharacterized protein n=1 Tax=Neolewinella aurantiaca TaxID=2602767 RepID=A0A5C7FR00_9BACT|nr:hypothetical protein [Neolewinella aurantiaca]TXF88484.1 hypothetical protein FUA23_14455 [Neolewinella aurantiaca]
MEYHLVEGADLPTNYNDYISMWKNLKSYFIVEEEGGPKVAKTLPDKSKPVEGAKGSATPKGAPVAPAPPPAQRTVSGSVNDRSVKVLMEAMEANNLPGFDYLEYKKSLQNLKKMDFTDSIRFQTAFATAQSMGVTPGHLQESAQHYLSVLENEHKKFSNALKAQRAAQVNNKEAKLQQIDADIKRQEAKIKELQSQIEKSRAEQTKLRETIKGSVDKLAKTQADFETTLSVITDGIRKDMANMKEFLK